MDITTQTPEDARIFLALIGGLVAISFLFVGLAALYRFLTKRFPVFTKIVNVIKWSFIGLFFANIAACFVFIILRACNLV
jgi:hypothetical protein